MDPFYIPTPGGQLLSEFITGGSGHGDPGDVHGRGVHDGGQDVGGGRPGVLDQGLHGRDHAVGLGAEGLAVPVHEVFDLREILALK